MQKKIKILHLENTPFDAVLIARELKNAKINFEILVVEDKKEFIEALKNFTHDIILSDHSLVSFDSNEALGLVKEMGITVPFILVTATMTEEFAVNIMKAGASDYILKDRLQRLPLAVVNSIEKHRLQGEQQLQHQQLAFHIENALLGFIEWDHQGFAKSWSKRAEEIFGWSRKEFIESQKTAFVQVSEEDLPWVSKMFEQLISGEVERNKVQYRNITKDGKIIWSEWFNTVLKDKDGKVKTIMSLVQDITEQKQLEWQKDNFLSIVSHELRTPLTTIKAYGQIAENMLETKGDADTLGIIKKMSSQVNKLALLVRNLLDFTRVQKGELIYHEDFFDFNEIVEGVINNMQKTSATHEIKSNIGETATIFGDKNKLSQVINSLISNAIKYSPKADSIIVGTELQKHGIQLCVEDSGIGISIQEQQNVFEQFYRVDRDNQSTFPGMGISLYVGSEIIRRHGGKIWVESSIDKGSTFFIWLPFDHRNKTTALINNFSDGVVSPQLDF